MDKIYVSGGARLHGKVLVGGSNSLGNWETRGTGLGDDGYGR